MKQSYSSLVFFYHLELNYFDYGFLGVDIFFVISGFVITSLIYHEIEITKKFNFINFYLKRIKRIYPVLFFILSISFVLVIFFQPLELFLQNFNVYVKSLFGISNFYYLFLTKRPGSRDSDFLYQHSLRAFLIPEYHSEK